MPAGDLFSAPGVAALFAVPAVRFIALLAMTGAYIQGGLVKLFYFRAAVEEMRAMGLRPPAPMAVAVIVLELGASAMILCGWGRWLGALALAGFTLAATFMANRFWVLRPPERIGVANAFFEHLVRSSREVTVPRLAFLLAVLAGYVDTAGFLALHGLFTAHVTGNFVTIGASLVFGTSGALSKLLALPVFCAMVALVRACGGVLAHYAGAESRILMGVQTLLLAVGAALAIRHGPFVDGDDSMALATGMVLVAAMAIQNAGHRIYLGSSPPSTLMTGNTTQIIIDLVDLVRRVPDEQRQAARQRAGRMGVSIAAFAAGCAGAAVLFKLFPAWCFALPPLLTLAAMASMPPSKPAAAKA